MSQVYPDAPVVLLPSGVLEQIACALQERLKCFFPPALFEHAIIPPRITPGAWEKVTRRMPFVGLGWGKLTGKQASQRIFTGDSTWLVLMVISNKAGEMSRLFGDARGPGLLQMARVGVAALHGWSIPNIGSVTVKEADNADMAELAADDLATCIIELSVNTTVPLATAIEPLTGDALQEFGATWIFDGSPVTFVEGP